MPPYKVLIVDDSALVREFLRELFESDPALEVIGVAADPVFARDKILNAKPDVLTLDIEMPRMDGLTFLKRLMAAHPLPVVMFSSHTESGAAATMEALSNGAVDFVAKPRQNLVANLPDLKSEILEKVKMAAKTKVRARPTAKQAAPAARKPVPAGPAPTVKYTADKIVPRLAKAASGPDKVVVLGASTGGTVAIEAVLTALPAEIPPLALVQHMPPGFTLAFAQRLDSICRLTVAEATNKQRMEPGLVLIAPGGSHLLLQRDGRGYFVEVKDGPPVNRHKPSVDVLFRSAVNSAGDKALAVLLTGMGDDGARGMRELHDAGAKTIAQDEASSVVYGMPRAAKEMGGVDKVVPLDQVARHILDYR